MPIKHKQKIQFYRHTKNGYLLRLLTLDDMSFWGSSALMSIVFTLFVVAEIDGGSASVVGIAFMLRELTIALLSIPIGKVLDKIKGHLDEIYFLSASGMLVGIAYLLLGFSTQIWQVYILMIGIGITHALNINSWRILFYGSIKNNERGQTTGVYQTIMSITIAIILAVGGFIADTYGFRITLFIGAIITIAGGFIPLLLRKNIIEEKRLIK